MFCDKCGAQLADTASFCNKCGNTIKKKENAIPKSTTGFQNTMPPNDLFAQPVRKQKKPSLKLLTSLIAVIVIIIAIVAIINRPSIYGTWSDTNRMITFTFHKDGNLQVSGKNNVLGADLFQYSIEDETIHLQALGGLTSMLAFDMNYELSKDTLTVNVNGYNVTLYRIKDSDIATNSDGNNTPGFPVDNESNSNPSSDIYTNSNSNETNIGSIDDIGNALEDTFENAMDVFQISFLYGTWSDNSGILTITFKDDNTVRIAGLEDTLGVELFTFSEYDNDTLQLKADTDNALLAMIKLNMDYEISGDTLTVTIAGQSFQLNKRN